MAMDFGSGVSRTLDAIKRQFQGVVWQKNRPPLDSELNLMFQIDLERTAETIRTAMHSGFLADPLNAQQDFVVDPAWSNFFKLGRQATGEEDALLFANVNGWIVPVSGTSVSDGDTSNRVDLWPPPSSDARIDLVFLEVYLSQVAPNPSTANKPSATRLWKYGNVKFGGTNILDDLEDPTIGFETTERIQLQYRIRVFGQGSGAGSSVALDDFPDGLDDPNVLGQGTATSPVAGITFDNMREELGDPGLWRAGNGDPTNDLGTVDGYTYAVPICAIFRRNTSSFVARTPAGNANQNGAVNRNPITAAMTDPAEGTVILGTATLTNDLDETTTGAIQITGLVGSGLDNTDINWDSTFLMLDDEIVSISSVDTTVSPATMTLRAVGGRGRWGTMAVTHAAGTTVQWFNWRHDGLFSDQIASTDILDLRRAVTFGEWDYDGLLAHNLSKLFKGELRTSYKQAAVSDTQGPVVVEVDTLYANGGVAVPNQTEALDGPDGIRTVWSDASVVQTDVTMLLDNTAPQVAGAVTQFDIGDWDVGAQFVPGGFMPSGAASFQNGTSIFIYIGGATGTNGARETFRDGSEEAVRFLMPMEQWKAYTDVDSRQTPVTLRFTNEPSMVPEAGTEPAVEHPGPLYPLAEQNFEYPFIVLGGVANTVSQSTGGITVFDETAPGADDFEVDIAGLDFDALGDWYSLDGAGDFENDPDALTYPLIHSTKTLWGMLTKNGTDLTGASSEVYLVIWGDAANPDNNGCFRIVGAGTVGYTTRSATAADRVRVEFVSGSATNFTNVGGLNGEIRTPYSHSRDDTGGSVAGLAAMCVVLTDVEGTVGGTLNPWNAGNLGALAISQPVASKIVLNTSLVYHPGRGGQARVADNIQRLAVVTAGSEYLRRAKGTLDATFPAAAGVPSNETYFDFNHVQTWNRLSSKGLTAPDAPDYGGNLVAFSEQDRESELFYDMGSKTLMFRPFLNRSMTLQRFTVTAGTLIPLVYPPAHGGFTTDGAGILTVARDTGYEVPPEFMPRFGRQDIPYYWDTANTGLGTFLDGINHLFTDSTTSASLQFNIIGGMDNGGVAGVSSIRFQTTSTSGLAYGQWGVIPGTAQNGYQARLYEDSTVVSSDLGRGLRGIQLPPWLGVARIYGVYDVRDFAAAGGTTFEANRYTPAAGTAANLLRKDANKQTLFIVQGGASDVTLDDDDHTYIIPEELIDITLSDSYVAGEDFDDLEYVVECVVFGFARGFINLNNYVLARLHSGSGAAAAAEIEGAEMCIPAPASINDQVYVAYNRTVYQGDPYMTRDGATQTTSDYEHRYGQVDQADAFAAKPAIQQVDSTGSFIPQTVNTRALEVLAQIDFWTTLGTGKIGGGLLEGTFMDVSFVYENQSGSSFTRVPGSALAATWQTLPRTFTEGQRYNTSRAHLSLNVYDNAGLGGGETIVITTPDGTATTLTEGVDWNAGVDAYATAISIQTAISTAAALTQWVQAFVFGNDVRIVSLLGGTEGQETRVTVDNPDALYLISPDRLTTGATSSLYLSGSTDKYMNASVGLSSTPLKLTGVTERLPLGLLLQDSDFLCEDPLHDGTSFLWTTYGKLSGNSKLPVPLSGGEEYTRVVGGVGTFLGMSDGSIMGYTPYHETLSPAGTRYFRLFRGGGSLFVISGDVPGGPVDWTVGSLHQELEPVLKGAALAGRAYLVRNFAETAFAGSNVTSHGDEIQMVIATQGILGSGSPAWTTPENILLSGMISPTGYGEGYAAADRYRLEGKPLVTGKTRKAPGLDPDLALFPYNFITRNTTV